MRKSGQWPQSASQYSAATSQLSLVWDIKPICSSWSGHSFPIPNTQPEKLRLWKEGRMTHTKLQYSGRDGIKNFRFLNSLTSAFLAICTFTVSKGITANLVLRSSERILAPLFLVIIRYPWGCHQSRAGWPASQPDHGVIRFQRGAAGGERGLGAGLCGWRGVHPFWYNMDEGSWIVTWVCDMFAVHPFPTDEFVTSFCIFISTSEKWAGKNPFQHWSKITWVRINTFMLIFIPSTDHWFLVPCWVNVHSNSHRLVPTR
jgi:hypothetical protein